MRSQLYEINKNCKVHKYFASILTLKNLSLLAGKKQKISKKFSLVAYNVFLQTKVRPICFAFIKIKLAI